MQLSRRSILPSSLACAFILAGCPGSSGDEGASTSEHEHGAEHGTTVHGTTAHATTAHETTAHGTTEHGTTVQATTEHGVDTADHDHSIDTSAEDPAVAYCACMLVSCHETYHGKWGEDEMAAEAACLLEADGLPMNGSDIDMGNFIECRQHFCDLAADDESLCANAIGDAVCI